MGKRNTQRINNAAMANPMKERSVATRLKRRRAAKRMIPDVTSGMKRIAPSDFRYPVTISGNEN